MLAPVARSSARRAFAQAVQAPSCARSFSSALQAPVAAAPSRRCRIASSAPAPKQRSLLRAVGVRSQHSDAASPAPAAAEERQVVAECKGTMAAMFRRLKLFSLTTLSLSCGLSPLLLLPVGTMPVSARLGICGAVLATSTSATGLIAFVGGPYVNTMRLIAPSASRSSHSIELDTFGWRMQPLRTTIYDPAVIRPTERPFATWEVSLNAPTPLSLADAPADAALPERILAETRNLKTGELLGRFVARYSRDTLSRADDGAWRADGKVEQEGHPLRHFYVHEELLGEEWQVLE